jgi:cystathionine gamma-synthase
METLSNPLLKVTDLKLISDYAHYQGALSVVDNSFVTPLFQRPLSDGVDLVVHATTKYIGGHGDVVSGVVVARERGPLLDEVRRFQQLEGAVPSPFDCWLVHRGIKTLAVGMRGHAENALKIALALQSDPLVEAVHYPGLESHPQHALAKRQLSGGFGGIVSIQLRGGIEMATAICAQVKIFRNATSFGTVDSLIQHQASSPTHGTNTGLAENLLRLSVGLEHPDDLIDDLRQAFRAAERAVFDHR